MTMLGGVPISVIMPPKMVAKDSGISVSETARLALAGNVHIERHQQRQRGDIVDDGRQRRATTAMMPIWTGTARSGATMKAGDRSTAPELTRPRETISTSAMMTTAG
jgi:hypothetical protein